jgi:peroxiredoxin
LSGWTVLFCYPWTGRPGLPNPPNWDNIQGAHGSTPQAEGYRDRYSEFCDRQVRVFGLSLQDPAYQAEFARRSGLPFTLLSDEDGRFSQSLSLDMFATGGVDYLKRVTLIVRDGQIVCRREDIKDPSRDAAEVLQWLDRKI